MSRSRKIKPFHERDDSPPTEEDRQVKRFNNLSHEKYIALLKKEKLHRAWQEYQRTKNEQTNVNVSSSNSGESSLREELSYSVTGGNAPRKELSIDRGWKLRGMEVVEWFVEAMSIGTPDPSLTKPIQPVVNCQCVKNTQPVTLYMMFAHLEMDVIYCRCTSRFRTLLNVQFLPCAARLPNVAIHFGMLNYFHTVKTVAEMTEAHFVKIQNPTNKGKPLTKPTLNQVYNIYVGLVKHAKDIENGSTNNKHTNCYICDVNT